jgi:hypothetical protein
LNYHHPDQREVRLLTSTNQLVVFEAMAQHLSQHMNKLSAKIQTFSFISTRLLPSCFTCLRLSFNPAIEVCLVGDNHLLVVPQHQIYFCWTEQLGGYTYPFFDG